MILNFSITIRKNVIRFAGTISVLIFFCTGAVIAQQDQVFYNRGMQQIEAGQPEEAVKLWLQAKNVLTTPSTRIGVAFIDLVTKEEMEEYYNFASFMYVWGLSADEVEPNKEALAGVVERTGVLVELNTYKNWKRLLRNDDRRLYDELRLFWKRKDLTPTTEYNERLVEQWQRINYSRKKFTRGNKKPFGTDGRGEIYVRYGAPDQIYKGNLEFNIGEARSHIQQISEIASNLTLTKNPNGQTAVRQFAEIVETFHQYPEYEVWVYPPAFENKGKQLFLFGDAGAETSGFSLIDSPEAFIPRGAYREARSLFRAYGDVPPPGLTDLSAATILQLMYYNQLAGTAGPFAEAYQKLESNLFSRGTEFANFARDIDFAVESALERPKYGAPKEESGNKAAMAEIPIWTNTYRLLNEKNQPALAIFIQSHPRLAFIADYVHNYRDKIAAGEINSSRDIFRHYTYLNTLQLINRKGETINRLNEVPTVEVKEDSVSISIMEVPVPDENVDIIASAELENEDPSSAYIVSGLLFPESLRGLGTTTVEIPELLNSNKQQLEAGDLIVGYDFKNDAGDEVRFPFTVANDQTIPVNKEIVVHFEVYHLAGKPGELREFSLQYKVEPESGTFSWLTGDKKAPLEIGLNFETNESRLGQNLQIKTRELKPGKYILTILVTDKQSGQQVKRRFEFEITEPDS